MTPSSTWANHIKLGTQDAATSSGRSLGERQVQAAEQVAAAWRTDAFASGPTLPPAPPTRPGCPKDSFRRVSPRPSSSLLKSHRLAAAGHYALQAHFVADIDPLLGHPAVLTYDALGRGWHVFDLDPTVKALRHRALPERDDLPEPRRRCQDTAAPGYAGRKRGDMVFRRIAVQHAGSGAWLHAHLSAGNGEGVADLGPALDTIAASCDRLGTPRTQALVRMDGEYGGVPSMTACPAPAAQPPTWEC